jgi:hypothetical protein
VGGLFDSAIGIAGTIVVIAVLLGLAYELFGSQAFGLPAILGVLALVGLLKLVSDAGLGNAGVLIVAAGLIAIPLVIGMAMKLGADPGTDAGSDAGAPAGADARGASASASSAGPEA